MPERKTLARAAADKRQGKAASTQAGEFVRGEMHHIRAGKHGARSTKQAIAIGLSKARRAGVNLKPPGKGAAPAKTRKTRESAKRVHPAGHDGADKPVSARRSRAVTRALEREPHSAASKASLAKQARSAARKRSASDRSAAARRGARTKGAQERSAAARTAAITRARRGH